MELTTAQIEQHDKIDNAIHDFLQDIFGNHGITPWNIEDIAEVRDALLTIGEQRGIHPGDFYPGIDLEVEANNPAASCVEQVLQFLEENDGYGYVVTADIDPFIAEGVIGIVRGNP